MTRASIYLIQNQQAAQRQLSEEATCEPAAQSTCVVGLAGGGGVEEDLVSESSFCLDSDRV